MIKSELRRFALSSVFSRGLVIGLALAALELIAFHGYFSGSAIPNWDFLDQIDVFAWWHDGSFFKPVEWLPYAWGGYPGTLDIQNDSWYLPVGLITLFGPLTLHKAAIVAALHVAAGALGVYLLARQWGSRFAPALLGLVIWFFASGFYANAESTQIARGYAWAPWLLLITSVRFPWHRWWAPIVAGVIVWQTILGVYPGMLVAGGYAIGTWIVVQQIVYRPRIQNFLLPMAIAAVAGVAMTLLRFLPALLVRGVGSPSAGDTSTLAWDSLGTLFYPYGDPALQNDITMRSFFLPVVAFALLGLISWKIKAVRAPLAMVAISIVIGLPSWPWHSSLIAILPGMSLSRFVMSDYKLYLLIGICFLGILGVNTLYENLQEVVARPPRISFVKIARSARFWYWTALVLMAFVWGQFGHFVQTEWLPQFALLTITVVLVAGLTVNGYFKPRWFVTILCVASFFSGVLSIRTTLETWDIPRASNEIVNYGAPVTQLLAERTPNTPTQQRPARVGPPHDPDPLVWTSMTWGRVFFSNNLTVFAYVNLKGTPTFDNILNSIDSPATSDAAGAFWAAKGMVIAAAPEAIPLPTASLACSTTGRCGDGLTTKPVSYSTGRYVYNVDARKTVRVQFNEAYYRGWHASICAVDHPSQCKVVAVAGGSNGEIAALVPRGSWILRLDYKTPATQLAWIIFWLGAGILCLWSLANIPMVRNRFRRSQ